MKISNFYPEKINASNELFSFDNCLVEYFEEIEFALFGSIEVKQDLESFICSNVDVLIITDDNGKKISLNDEIKKEIEKEIESLFNKEWGYEK